MELQEVLSQIEDESLKEGIVNLINAEKDRGISSTNKKDKEVLKYKNAFKELGWDSEKYENISDFVSTRNKDKEKITESNLTIAQLNDKMNDLLSSLNAEKEQNQKIATEAKNSKLTAKLTEAIGKDFYGASYLIKDLVQTGQVDIDGDSVVFKQDDKTIGFEEGITTLREKHRDMIRTTQQSGTGDKGGDTPPQKKLTFTEAVKQRVLG